VIPVIPDSSNEDSVPPEDPIQPKIESRLAELKNEYEKGQLQLQRLHTELADLQQVMLRLSGAITVLEELLKPESEIPGATYLKEAQHDRDRLATQWK
jgi:hypothetical protein